MPVSHGRSSGTGRFSDVFERKEGRSYVYHYCSVVAMNDVLKHNIPGDHLKARLKRWWWNLFLASNKKHHILFTSSHGLRVERIRQFKKHKNMIHPLSRFRVFWDFIILHLLVLYDVFFHLNTSVYYGDMSRVPYLVNAFIEIVRIFDIMLNLRTGYIDKLTRRVELNVLNVILHYCSTKLFLHVIASIPLTWLIFIRYGSSYDCSLCKTNQFIVVLKFLNVFNLIRVYECSEYWIHKNSDWAQCYKLVRICVLGLLTLLQFRELSDISVIQIMVANGEIEDESRIGNGLFIRYVVFQNETSWPLSCKLFVYDICRFVKCFFLYSFNPRAEYILDRLSTLVGVVIVKVFVLWIFMELYHLIATKVYIEDDVFLTEMMTNNMLRSFQLPDFLERKVHKYFDYRMSKIKLMENTNTILKTLPKVLREETFTDVYSRYLERISYFTRWPENVISDLVLMLKDCIYLNGDLVAEPWMQAEGLVIVAHGELAVYTDLEETGHLIDGDYFGELSLVTDLEIRTSCVVAISPSLDLIQDTFPGFIVSKDSISNYNIWHNKFKRLLVLILKKNSFRRYMRQYPGLFLTLQEELNKKFGNKTSISTQQLDSERTAHMKFNRLSSDSIDNLAKLT